MTEKPIPKYIGDQLREAREAAGFTQKQVGQALGAIDGRSISDLERGVRTLSFHRLQALVDLYERSIVIRPKTAKVQLTLWPDL